MVEIDNIELWDDWYLHYMCKKIQKEIARRENQNKIQKEDTDEES